MLLNPTFPCIDASSASGSAANIKKLFLFVDWLRIVLMKIMSRNRSEALLAAITRVYYKVIAALVVELRKDAEDKTNETAPTLVSIVSSYKFIATRRRSGATRRR